MQSSDANADEALHFVANLIKHAANLAIDALAQDHAHSGWLGRLNFLEPGALPVEHDPAEELRRESWIPRTVESDLVFLLDFVTRMGESLREVAVIREEKKAFSLGVEPANVEKPRQMRREQIEDGVACVRIRSRGNEASRLVEKEMKPALAVHELAADFDMVALRRLGAEVRANPAVDRDAAFRNQLVALPPRTDAGGSEETVQAHGDKS